MAKREFKDEGELVGEFHRLLVAAGWISHPQNSHVGHGNSRYIKGTPDILAASPKLGTFYGFELKVNGNGLTKSQKDMRKAYENRKHGDRYVIVNEHNYEDVLRKLTKLDSVLSSLWFGAILRFLGLR